MMMRALAPPASPPDRVIWDRPVRQFWTGVTNTTDREAGDDTGSLNRQTRIPIPDGPLEEIDLAAAVRRALQG